MKIDKSKVENQQLKLTIEAENNEIDNLRPPFMCKFSSRVRIVINQVTGQKRSRNNQCGDHAKSVCSFVSLFNENDPAHYETGSDSIKCSINDWKVLNGHSKNIRIP